LGSFAAEDAPERLFRFSVKRRNGGLAPDAELSAGLLE
jgi:hypothetical protein